MEDSYEDSTTVYQLMLMGWIVHQLALGVLSNIRRFRKSGEKLPGCIDRCNSVQNVYTMEPHSFCTWYFFNFHSVSFQWVSTVSSLCWSNPLHSYQWDRTLHQQQLAAESKQTFRPSESYRLELLRFPSFVSTFFCWGPQTAVERRSQFQRAFGDDKSLPQTLASQRGEKMTFSLWKGCRKVPCKLQLFIKMPVSMDNDRFQMITTYSIFMISWSYLLCGNRPLLREPTSATFGGLNAKVRVLLLKPPNAPAEQNSDHHATMRDIFFRVLYPRGSSSTRAARSPAKLPTCFPDPC